MWRRSQVEEIQRAGSGGCGVSMHRDFGVIILGSGKRRPGSGESVLPRRENGIVALVGFLFQHFLSFLCNQTAFTTHQQISGIALLYFPGPLTYQVIFFPIRFMNFVDRVFFLRDSLDINKFRLAISESMDFSRIDAWICIAVMRNVVELDLESVFKYYFLLSSYIRVFPWSPVPSH
ncbi:hypothetical protein ACFX1W_029674 [Malus domestica]